MPLNFDTVCSALVAMLKPCPWCGKKPNYTITSGGLHHIECATHEAHCEMKPATGFYGKSENAIAAWQTRKP